MPEWLSVLAHALWAALLSAGLAGCPERHDPPPEHPGQSVACALDGAEHFASQCKLEQVGALWVLTRPDGGFVRLKRTAAGAVTTDGFPRVAARRVAGRLELGLGHDRYRLPW